MLNTAHFIKVRENMSWADIKHLTNMVNSQGCKPMPYKIIAEVILTKSEFAMLSESLSQPNASYLEYTNQSTPSNDGIWNCIAIKQKPYLDEILLYTAGRTFPLYIALNSVQI